MSGSLLRRWLVDSDNRRRFRYRSRRGSRRSARLRSARMTSAASTVAPLSSRATRFEPPPCSIPSTLAEVCTVMPLLSHHRLRCPPAVSSSIRGTIRFSISTTVRSTPRRTSASRMMQPMKPAPISSTGAPLRARLRMWRASASVQHGCTPGRSIPDTGGAAGWAPEAINNLS